MQQFIGNKIINATAMTRKAYNDLRGWQVPADENPDDDGFLVEYLDGGKANVAGYSGYVSWSPKDVFDRAYRPTSAMSFGDALIMLRAGLKVARIGWNGKGMFLILVKPESETNTLSDSRPVYRVSGTPEGVCLPWIGMKTADGGFVPWLASQTDMLAEDWMVSE